MNLYLRLLWSPKLKRLIFAILLSGIFMACQKESLNNELSEMDVSVNATNKVKVTSTHLNFEAPEKIPSGWTTFDYRNKSHGTHFFILARLPEGKTLEDYETDVTPYFQTGMDAFRASDFDTAFGTEGFGGIGAWYGGVVINGGPGLLSPDKKANTTVYLEPATYVIECYVKGKDGQFHSYNGMIAELEVTEEKNSKKEPKADTRVTIDTETGITLLDEVKRPGKHIFSVEFLSQTAHGNLLGHDVHLVKFDEGISDEQKETLNNWMNWLYVGPGAEGLMLPQPDGFTFLGGTQELPAGDKSYFKAVLEPGKYALISEIDDPMGKGMYAEFEIK